MTERAMLRRAGFVPQVTKEPRRETDARVGYCQSDRDMAPISQEGRAAACGLLQARQRGIHREQNDSDTHQ
jgi:hypothetical protein